MKTYPIANENSVIQSRKYLNMKAIYTGEKRSPRKGEWYLSGAIVEAYQAPNDLNTPFHIARLVKVEKTETFKIIEGR